MDCIIYRDFMVNRRFFIYCSLGIVCILKFSNSFIVGKICVYRGGGGRGGHVCLSHIKKVLYVKFCSLRTVLIFLLFRFTTFPIYDIE